MSNSTPSTESARLALAAEHKQLLMRLEYDLPSIRQQAEEYDPTRVNSHLARVNPKFLLQVCELALAALSSQPPAPSQQELRALFEASINRNEWCTTYDLEWDASINSYDSCATHDAWAGFKAAFPSAPTKAEGST